MTPATKAMPADPALFPVEGWKHGIGVPWEMIAPHAGRLTQRTGEVLEDVAQDGGLSAQVVLSLLGESDPFTDADSKLYDRVIAWRDANRALPRPITQDPGVGECLRCALASLFGIPKDATPVLGADLELSGYEDHKDDLGSIQDAELNEWCRDRGLSFAPTTVTDGYPRLLFNALAIASGLGPRGYHHAVVWDLRHARHNADAPLQFGSMIHDPHPSGDGLLEVDLLYYFLVADPERFFAWARRVGAEGGVRA